jgi:hypothetical protein
VDAVNDLNAAIHELQKVSRALVGMSKAVDAVIDRIAGAAETTPQTPPEPPKFTPLTLEQVRAVLAEKSRNGYTPEIRTLLEKYGASKLTDVDPGNYAALLKEAEVLGNV